MKRIISNVMLVAAAATAFFSCQKQEVIAPETSQEVNGLVFASEKPAFDDETKTEWTGETIQWSKGDKIRVAYTCDGVWQNAEGTATASEEDGYKTAKFYPSVELEKVSETAQFNVPGKFAGDAEGEYEFYAVYPSSVVGSSDMKNAPSFNVILPSVQTPLADSFDPESDVMVAQSDVYEGMPEEAISLKWNRKVAHANITLKAINGISDDEQVISVKITAQETANMVGIQKYDLENDAFVKHDDNMSANVIEINGANLSVENGNVVFWASFLPCTWESFTVELNTNKATYTRTVETCNLEFKQNARNTLAIKMQDAEVASRVSEITETLTFNSTSKRTEFTTSKQVWEENGITLTNNKASSTNNVADYSNPARFYQNSSIVVSAPGNITKIVFDCNSTSYATALANSIGSTATASSDMVTVSFTPAVESFTVAKLTGQVRMDAVTVTYQTAGGSGDTPDFTPELSVTETVLKIDHVESSEVVAVSTKNLYDIEANAFADAECTSDCDWLAAEWTPEGIRYTVTENTSNELREGYIQITGLDLENNEYSEVITVSQATSFVAKLTIEEFLDKEVHPYMWYQLTGVMSNIKDTTFGNFDLEDETGKVYVYGLKKDKTSANTTFSQIGLRTNDEVTLIGNRAVYNTTDQVGNAYYVTHVPAPYFELTSATGSVAYDATTFTVNFESNLSWTATPSAGVSLNSTSGTGNGSVVMTFAANETDAENEYSVTFTAGEKSATFTLTQAAKPAEGGEQPQIVFSETFTGTNGTMGWTGTVANGNSIKYDNAGWSVTNAYGASNAIKLGSSSKKGSATTPALAITGNATLKFKAGAWSGDQTTLILKISSGTLSQTSVTLKSGDWTEYEISITGATSGTKITFEGKQASKARFFLDDVQIIQ